MSSGGLLGGATGGAGAPGAANMMGALAPAMMMLMQAMPQGGMQLPRFNTPGSRTYHQTGPVNSSNAAAQQGRQIGNQVGRTVGRAINQAAQQA